MKMSRVADRNVRNKKIAYLTILSILTFNLAFACIYDKIAKN